MKVEGIAKKWILFASALIIVTGLTYLNQDEFTKEAETELVKYYGVSFVIWVFIRASLFAALSAHLTNLLMSRYRHKKSLDSLISFCVFFFGVFFGVMHPFNLWSDSNPLITTYETKGKYHNRIEKFYVWSNERSIPVAGKSINDKFQSNSERSGSISEFTHFLVLKEDFHITAPLKYGTAYRCEIRNLKWFMPFFVYRNIELTSYNIDLNVVDELCSKIKNDELDKIKYETYIYDMHSEAYVHLTRD